MTPLWDQLEKLKGERAAMTYETDDADLFLGTMAGLAEAIIELRRHIAELEARIKELEFKARSASSGLP
jgi:hypothetical protein